MEQNDTDGNPGAGLSLSLSALGKFVLSDQSLQETLLRVAELSVRAVHGADGAAGVTWVVADKPTTVTAAGDFVSVVLTRSSTASTRGRA